MRRRLTTITLALVLGGLGAACVPQPAPAPPVVEAPQADCGTKDTTNSPGC